MGLACCSLTVIMITVKTSMLFGSFYQDSCFSECAISVNTVPFSGFALIFSCFVGYYGSSHSADTRVDVQGGEWDAKLTVMFIYPVYNYMFPSC